MDTVEVVGWDVVAVEEEGGGRQEDLAQRAEVAADGHSGQQVQRAVRVHVHVHVHVHVRGPETREQVGRPDRRRAR